MTDSFSLAISQPNLKKQIQIQFLHGIRELFWEDKNYEPKPRLITLDEVSMPAGNGQIVGFERCWFDNDVADSLGFAAFGMQPASRFQIFRFNPFAARIKRMDAVGN